MYEVDRIAVVIKPSKKVLEWLHQQAAENQELTLEALQSDCTTLLIPPFEHQEQAQQYMDEIFEAIFENELESWGIEEEHWPQKRTLDLFSAWFDLEYHSIVFDVVAGEVAETPEQLQ